MTPLVPQPVTLWDLNMTLIALQKPPFEPFREIPLSTLTRKVAFLVAMTSARHTQCVIWQPCVVKHPF